MGKDFTTIEPATGHAGARWEYMDGQLAQSLTSARRGFETWRATSVSERARLVRALGERLATAAPRLGALACREMGKPLAQAVKEVEKCAAACRYYGAHAEELLERLHVTTEAARSYVSLQPLGPILSIMPWNFPYWQVIRFGAPALTAGNAFIVKHADNTTGCAMALQEVFDASGFPAGVAQTVIAEHADVPAMIRSPEIAAVTLTGSERAGRAVASVAGDALKKQVLELGGSDAYLVLHDADVELAAATCVEARLVNSGQSCVAAKRFIVVDAVHDAFVEAFVEKAKTFRIGPPEAPETRVGPLAKASIRDEVARQVEQSLSRGAKAAHVGPRPQGGGFWYPVTVLTGVTPGMPAFDEEVFGPVAAIIRARDEDEAVALANRSRFGLGAAVFSRDVARAEQLAEARLEAGFCAVNTMVASDPRLPFGGVKASGYGRELGSFGLREFVNVKTVVVR
jgi:succinate-semialdehyde dehydrogenase/glutarate-semialdehyde dehydrogenase